MALSADEQAELESLQGSAQPSAASAPVAQAPGLTDAEKAEMAALHGEVAPTSPLKSALLSGLHGAGTALGYLGGNVRNAAAQAVDAVAPTHLTKDGDTMNALKGNAPSTAEYMERQGVPKGMSVSDAAPSLYSADGKGLSLKKGGALDPSVRGVAGFVGDTALDPLTYLSAGLSRAAKAGTSSELLQRLLLANGDGLNAAGKTANVILNPVEAAARPLAGKAYASAFKKLDGKIVDKPETLAQIAQETGFVGSGAKFADHIAGVNDQAGKEIGNVLNEATQKGASVDLDKSFEPALQRAKELRETIGTKEANQVADQIEARVNELKDAHGQYVTKVSPAIPAEYETPMYGQSKLKPGTGVPESVTQTRTGAVIPADQANKIKTDMNNYTRFTTTDTDAVADQARKALAGPLSSDVKGAVKSADQELYDRLIAANNRFSSTSPKIQKMVDQFGNEVANKRNPLVPTKVDLGLLGAGLTGHASALGALAAKKVGDVVTSTQGKTAIGYGLNKVGQNSNGILDAALRQLILKQQAKETNP